MSDPLIPRAHLFGNPTRAAAQISPDGQRVGFLAPLDGVLNVFVGPADDVSAARAVTADTGRGIRSWDFAEDGRHVLYVQDKDGDENWHLYATDLASGVTRDLTPIDGVQARLVAASHKHPDTLLIGLNDRVPEYHDVWRLDLPTGERTLVLRNDRFLQVMADDAFRIRVGVEPFEAGFGVFRAVGDDWEPLLEVGAEDELTTGPALLANDTLVLLDSRGRDTAALVTVDLRTGAARVVATCDEADITSVLAHPTTHALQGWAAEHARVEWRVTDPGVAADLAKVQAAFRGDVDIASRSRDDRRWVVLYTRDDAPAVYALFDRDTGAITPLFTTRPELEGAPLARMHPRVIPARDGLPLVTYLTLPRWADHDGVPSEPLPTVLVVHGGPWARDSFGFNPYHQLLANRGYAVLSVNFRGSTGLGKAFLNAANLEWGRAMHTDLLDVVDWAVAQGIARRDAVAIFGGSYGGYAALAGLAFTPEVFACGVDLVGPSNLETLIASIPAYWAPMLETMCRRIGDPRTPDGLALLRERSPLHQADRIVRPLLIAQGANDPRVKQPESDQIVAAMQSHGLPVTYLLYPDEGHGFARPQNSLSFIAVAEGFLARVLGGRAEALDLTGSSVTVPAGAAHVAGLAEAVAP